MSQVRIRYLDDLTVFKLKLLAKQSGRSLEGEIRTILEDVVKRVPSRVNTPLADIRTRFAGRKFEDSTDLIRADRDR